jgi:ribosomal protein S18 acetylase RimI-like enzyme
MVAIEHWDGERAVAASSALWPVYDAAFGDADSEQAWRESTLARHAVRRDFRMAVAYQDSSAPVGFAYGYVGELGQFWPDRVAGALPAATVRDWVGGHFEFVELAVLSSFRRRGIGGALHDALMTDLPSDRALLSTDDEDTPAVRLYRSRGWRRLGQLEPGVQVMGWRP